MINQTKISESRTFHKSVEGIPGVMVITLDVDYKNNKFSVYPKSGKLGKYSHFEFINTQNSSEWKTVAELIIEASKVGEALLKKNKDESQII